MKVFRGKPQCGDFMTALDAFVAQLPIGWHYVSGNRNRIFLDREGFRLGIMASFERYNKDESSCE